MFFCFDSRNNLSWKIVTIIFSYVCFFFSSVCFCESVQPDRNIGRYRVFSLRNIPADQVKDILEQLEIGSVSQIPDTQTLLVTATPQNMAKASAMIKLIDSNHNHVIKQVPVSFLEEKAVSVDELSQEMTEQFEAVSFGTFLEPPQSVGPSVIIDQHNGRLLVIAPKIFSEKIIESVKNIKSDTEPAPKKTAVVKIDLNRDANSTTDNNTEKKLADQQSDTETADHNEADVENDLLFEKLVSSLENAEQKAKEEKQKEVEEEQKEETETKSVLTSERQDDEEEKPQPSSITFEIIEEKPQPQVSEEETTKSDLELKELLEEFKKKQEQQKYESEEVELGQEPMVEQQQQEYDAVQYIPGFRDANEIEFNNKGEMEIEELIKLVGIYLHLDYIYDQKDVTGKVKFYIDGKMKIHDLYPLLEDVLKLKGLVMTRRGRFVKIVKKENVIDIDPEFLTDPKQVKYGDVVVSRVFHLKHVDPGSAKNLLTNMKLGLHIETIDETGTIIVTEYTSRMSRVEELLSIVDIPGEEKQFRFRQLRYTMAQTLAPKLKDLSDQLGTVSITISQKTTPQAAASARSARARALARARARRARAQQQQQQPAPSTAADTEAETVYLDFDERTNRILMIGLENQLAVVDSLIDALDVEQQDLRTMRMYEIQYVGAEEIKEKLLDLGIIGQDQMDRDRSSRYSSSRERSRSARSARQRPQAQQQTPQPSPAAVSTGSEKEPLVEEPLVVIVESTNSLLVNATTEQHAQIAMIIGYIDSEPVEAAINYKVYPLENQDPEELAEVLLKLIQETITERDERDSKITRTTVTRKVDEEIFIVPDPKTYSLIVYASKKNQQWISSLIDQLDEYRPQVLLDVTLVEITKNDSFNYDLNVINSIPNLDGTSGLANVVKSVEGGDSITTNTILNSLQSANKDRFIDLQSKQGQGIAFYGDVHVNVLLNLVQSKGYGRILARPKLLVNDNEEGEIKSENTTYRTRTETIVQTTEGDPITSENVVYEDYTSGITLLILPHISKGDQLQLKITLERSDFQDTEASTRETNPTPPDLVKSNVDTKVTVPDGTTIILGGLEKLNQSKSGQKVPLLGDIPLVGGLFRTIANTNSQSRLYVFIKANIVRPGKELTDLREVSAYDRQKFEKYEKEMQEYEDWPGFKADPIDPVRVLEKD